MGQSDLRMALCGLQGSPGWTCLPPLYPTSPVPHGPGLARGLRGSCGRGRVQLRLGSRNAVCGERGMGRESCEEEQIEAINI